MHIAKLGIDKDFLADFARLESPIRKRVAEAFGKFEQATHAGIHPEPVQDARDDRFRTIRIDLFWRGVVLARERGDLYTLLKVLPHDDAYAWAQRRRVSVNSANGRIEIRDVDATLPELSRMAERTPDSLLDGVNDADLRRLGVDEQTLEFARVLTDLVQLEASRAFLPENQYDVLIGLVLGYSPEQVRDELGGGEPGQEYDTDDIAAAVERTPERVVLVEGPAELVEVFEPPFALWRIYLTPHSAGSRTARSAVRPTSQVGRALGRRRGAPPGPSSGGQSLAGREGHPAHDLHVHARGLIGGRARTADRRR